MKNTSFSSTRFGKFLIFFFSMLAKIDSFFTLKLRCNQIEVERMEDCVDNFTDLIGKSCKVLKIEKYPDSGAWILFFSCENINYSIRLVEKYINKNKILLLKSKEFKFVKGRYCIQVEPDKEAYNRNLTSLEVWIFDSKAKKSRGYVSL